MSAVELVALAGRLIAFADFIQGPRTADIRADLRQAAELVLAARLPDGDAAWADLIREPFGTHWKTSEPLISMPAGRYYFAPTGHGDE